MHCIYLSFACTQIPYLFFLDLYIRNIISTGPKKQTISWSLKFSGNQTVLHYHANYRALNETSKPLFVSNLATSITVDVDYDKYYIFEIQVETQVGKSKIASIPWLSQTGILCQMST